LIRDFVTHCRQVLIAVIGGEDALKEQISVQSHIVDLIRQAKSLTLEEAKDISTLSRELGDQAIRSSFPEYAFEALVIRLATRAKAIDLKNLINAIQNNKNISQATSTSTTTSAQIQKSYTNTPSAKSNNGSEANQFGNKSWNSFVEFVQTKSRMLSEQLKRVSLNKFEDSVLELSAPEFSFNYLDKKENRDTLLKLLTEFSPSANGWKFNLKLVESKQGAAEGSIVDLEVAKQQKTKASKEAKVLESPHIQAIQNLFPGSKINVKVKE
jgi:hypothetical protein